MFSGSGVHVWNHHVFSWLQELKALVWCKPICVSTSFPFLCWFWIVCIISGLFFDYPFWNQCCLYWFLWRANRPLARWGVVSFSLIYNCMSFEKAKTSYATSNNLSSLSTLQNIESIFFCCLVVAIVFAHLWYLPISNLH